VLGKISSIETCGTLDGPGIRFVVFFQGCNLQCIYCHNPETWDTGEGRNVSIDELMDQIRRYRTYFTTGGGVTASGGEPLLQAPFVTRLFELCKRENIHTALDTSGSTIPEGIDDLLAYTDLVLLDIKHTDRKEYRFLTKGQNMYWQRWLTVLEEKKKPYWVRQVLLPGITDTEKYLTGLAGVLKNLKYCQKIELLPYHDLAVKKWKDLGMEYSLKDLPPMGDAGVRKSREFLQQYGLKV